MTDVTCNDLERRVAGDKYMVKPNQGLVVNKLSKDDAGDYTCRAETIENGKLKNRIIRVIVDGRSRLLQGQTVSGRFSEPPKITQPLGDQEGIEGVEATMSCRASGSPEPEFQFFKVSY